MRWGRFFWTTMHVAALGYPDNANEATRQQYKQFYTNLGHVLPCAKCRRNYAQHFQELPIDLYMYDKTSLFAWTVQLHNIVNKETGKREWTPEEARTFYTTGAYADGETGSGARPNIKIIKDGLLPGGIVAGVLLVILVVVLYKARMR